MAAFTLPPLLGKFRQQHPKISIEIVATNAASDLKKREADIAIRFFRPNQQDLIAKKLRTLHAYLYASSAYLSTLGHPTNSDDFHHAEFIGFCDNDQYLAVLNEQGFPLHNHSFLYLSENHLVHWEMVKQGMGIGVMEASIGDSEPSVERVLRNTPVYKSDVWLVAHSELRTNRRVKTVFDFLAKHLC